MMRFIPLIAVICLTACGFSPMYGNMSQSNNANVVSQLNQTSIAIIPNRDGQFLRNELIDRFYKAGMPANPRYDLQISQIVETVSDYDITIESEATRRQLKLTTSMELIDKQSEKIVLKRSLLAITSHNVLESEFSTLVTEQSAREAALVDLAKQVERQLTLYFSR